ncbi:hypothetical protein ACFLXQ_02660 [Chloroflexota bacterium]
MEELFTPETIRTLIQTIGAIIVAVITGWFAHKTSGTRKDKNKGSSILGWVLAGVVAAITFFGLGLIYDFITRPPVQLSPTQVFFYREGNNTPFLTETGELCQVLKRNLDNVEIPERYFIKLDMPEDTTVRVENVTISSSPSRELPIVVRPKVVKCVIGLSQNYRAALHLPEELGKPGDPARYGHELNIILPGRSSGSAFEEKIEMATK